MALNFFWRCEGLTLDGTHDETLGDSTAFAQGPTTLSNTAVRVGTNGILCQAVGVDANMRFDITSLASPTLGAVGFWHRWVTQIPNDSSFMVLRNSTQNSAIRMVCTGGQGSNIDFEVDPEASGAQILTTTGGVLNADTWYFSIVRWDQPNNKRRIEIFDTNMVLLDLKEDHVNAYTAPDTFGTYATGIRLGVVGAITQDMYVDNFFIADSYAEPIQNNATITSFTAYNSTPAALPQLPSGPPCLIASVNRHIGA